MNNKDVVQKLSKLTTARICLGHSGISIKTKELLDFQLAHAMAKDAVYLELDTDILQELNLEIVKLQSKAKDRASYLQRPDFGKSLNDISVKKLEKYKSYDLAIVVADGLSSLAIHKNALNYIKTLITNIPDWSLAPICIVNQGRVAIGDEIGELLDAKVVIVLIGERPGLSSPDSLGMYLTWGPKVGLTDESRNCISNIREHGLSYKEAVEKTVYLLNESKRLKYSGVNLKERTSDKQIKSKQKFLNL
jgi:ethanolamine ammonia-lyase small subunit